MCGIAGIWGNPASERLRAMAGALCHRGPDDEGFWHALNREFGFAHRRLSIIDPTGGAQPMANEDGTVVTVFNGAIYNYTELRKELAADGHRLATSGDTETIVHTYEDDAEGFLDRLHGMFALAVWDDRRQTLTLARDRAGKRPLYFYAGNDEFIFASEIKGILAALDARPDLDHAALTQYLTWTFIPGPRTIYRGIQTVMPGEVLTVRNRQIEKRRRYWRPVWLPKESIDRAEAIERTEQLLRRAVRLRLRADVPIGAFLSGGIDSGLVTAIAAQEHNDAVRTITIGFENSAFDERPAARLVAERYGTRHEEVVVRPNVREDLPGIIAAYDQPFADSSAIPSFYVARAARQHVKVALNGDGADEQFAGYRRYLAAQASGWLRAVDGGVSQKAFRLLERMLPKSSRSRSGYGFTQRFVRGMGLSQPERYLAWAIDGFMPSELMGLYGESTSHMNEALRTAGGVLEGVASCGEVDRMLAVDYSVVLPFEFLVKMDIACMAHGLEARSPLLDTDLTMAVSRWPEKTKLGGGTTKPILRELARRYLPDSIVNAPKRGFEVPLADWLRGELAHLSRDVILNPNGLPCELFDRKHLEDIIGNQSGLDSGRWSKRVWMLMVLGLWDQQR